MRNKDYKETYQEYWSKKGEYGLERLKRAAERKEKKKIKGLCKCGNNPKSELHTCPYDEDMHGSITWCRCCSDCYNTCLGDI